MVATTRISRDAGGWHNRGHAADSSRTSVAVLRSIPIPSGWMQSISRQRGLLLVLGVQYIASPHYLTPARYS